MAGRGAARFVAYDEALGALIVGLHLWLTVVGGKGWLPA